MGYNIVVKKLQPIDDLNYLMDIFNYRVIVYLKHNNKIIKAEIVEKPSSDLFDVIKTLGGGKNIPLNNIIIN